VVEVNRKLTTDGSLAIKCHKKGNKAKEFLLLMKPKRVKHDYLLVACILLIL